MLTRLVNLRSAFLLGVLGSLLASSTAHAGAPATVTVRVEGLTETKVPSTLVTTAATPIVASGEPAANACPGNSALGALDTASSGKWSGTWYGGESKGETFEGLGYSVESIDGESHLFEKGSNANYYWSFWFNDELQEEHGLCEVSMVNGDRVLMFVECAGSACPPNPTPLEIEAPAAADVGEEVPVTVKQYNAKGEASPAVGANVIGGGAGASTDSQGHATLKFFAAGTYMLSVSGAPSGPPAVRTEATICVHNGNDGTCGTSVPKACPVAAGAGTGECGGQGPTQIFKSPPVDDTDTAVVGGVKSGRVYARRHAPRLLSGVIEVPAAGTLKDVRISLERRVGKRCFVFSGVKETFVRARCGMTRFFSVGASESFSYLLPSSLPAGRYVYDVEAIDDAGKATKLVPGVSHVVFYVK